MSGTPVEPSLQTAVSAALGYANQAKSSQLSAASSAAAAATSAAGAATTAASISTISGTVSATLASVQSYAAQCQQIQTYCQGVQVLVINQSANFNAIYSSTKTNADAAAAAVTSATTAAATATSAATSASASATSAASSASAAQAAANTVTKPFSLQGSWNPSTNSPALASGVGTDGYVYICSTSGTTTLDGISSWNASDLAYFFSGTWHKIDGLTLEVTSVAGRTGAVTLTSADLTDATTAGKALLTATSAAAQKTALAITYSDVSGSIPTNTVANSSLAQMATLTIKSNVTGSTANAADNSLSAILDAALGSTVGKVPVRSSSGWVAGTAPGAKRSARTSNTAIASTDVGTFVDITSGTFNQTFLAASSIGAGSFIIRNSGSGTIYLFPNGTDTIDGYSGYYMYPNECRQVFCDGAGAFTTVILVPFYLKTTSSLTFYWPPGYACYQGYAYGGGGSGGSGGNFSNGAATGAGGAPCVPFLIRAAAITPGANVSIAVGAGAPAVAGTATLAGTFGNGGGTTTIGSLVSAPGGYGGSVGSSGTGYVGAAGSTEAAFSGQTNPMFDGGAANAGNSSTAPSNTAFGSAPGGSAHSTQAGNNGGTSLYGGSGGNAGTSGASPTAGSAGSTPGGGGGAGGTANSGTGGTSGAGGGGQVDMWGVL